MTAMAHQDSDPVLEVSELRCRYGSFVAVDGVDLTVRRGEIFALLGTNGAGKTTVLEAVEGYRARAGGRITVLGGDPWLDRGRLRPRLGIMLQDTGFVGELTVLETLRLWRRLSSRGDYPAVQLDRVDLVHRKDVPVGKLSGGERRRLDFALATWGSPELLVLDEPTTGLDPESRQRIWSIVRELRAAGATVLLTTHYLDEAEELADRLAVMHAGRIAVAGSLTEVLADHPAMITADVPATLAEELPAFTGVPRLDAASAAHRPLRIETTDLQTDLTRLLGWADTRGLRLPGLRAAPASLARVFHAITERAEQ
jgi:ABC-2 type transport system ATP-binding protein